MPNNPVPPKTPAVCIICHSIHHGNTTQLAKAIAEEFVAGGWQADLLDIEEAAAADLEHYQLVGFGSGIYFGRHHPEILQLPGKHNGTPRAAFILSTAGLPFLKWFQHAALRNRLKRSGIPILGEHCSRGWDTVGPLWLMGGINRKHPNEHDLERAKAFARELIKKVEFNLANR